MFNTIIDKYNNSERTKEHKLECLKGIHGFIILISQLKRVINNSVIESFEITKDGVYILLDKSRGGIKMIFNIDDYEEAPVEVVCSSDYENNETDLFLKIIDEVIDDSFVLFDIGANVGWYSLLTKSLYNKSIVYSFEPAPITYKRLINNIQLNNQTIDNAFNLALFNKEGELDFYYDIEGSGGSSFVNLRERMNIEKVSVKTELLDNFVINNRIDKIDFIKCDVEGSELFVFEGGINSIKEFKPIIFTEMLRKWSAKFDYTPNDIIQLLGNIGYECFAISDNKQLRYCPQVTEDTTETNYYFLHKEKHKNIIAEYCIV